MGDVEPDRVLVQPAIGDFFSQVIAEFGIEGAFAAGFGAESEEARCRVKVLEPGKGIPAQLVMWDLDQPGVLGLEL